ncbi:MAG: zinc-ribbon domain-containing protein [Candidatus Bathyarchaeia archaeon]
MRVCVNCNYPNKDDGGFCTRCGKELGQGRLQCPRCGAGIKAGSRFCDTCGSRLSSPEPEVPLGTAEDLRVSITAINEQFLAEAKARLASTTEKSLGEAELRLSELSRRLLAGAEANMRGSSSRVEKNLIDAEEKLNGVISSLAEDLRSLNDKLRSLSSSYEAASETYRRKIEAELGTAPTTPQVMPPAQPKPDTKQIARNTCQFCGTPLRDDSKFCPMCGVRVGETQPEKEQKPAKPTIRQAPVPSVTALPPATTPEKLSRLKSLLDSGVITTEEFESQKNLILLPQAGVVRPFGVTLLSLLYLVGAILGVVGIASLYLLLQSQLLPLVQQLGSLDPLFGDLLNPAYYMIPGIMLVIVDLAFAYGLFKGLEIARVIMRVLAALSIVSVIIIVLLIAALFTPVLSLLGAFWGGTLGLMYVALALVALIGIAVPLAIFWYLGRPHVRGYFSKGTKVRRLFRERTIRPS